MPTTIYQNFTIRKLSKPHRSAVERTTLDPLHLQRSGRDCFCFEWKYDKTTTYWNLKIIGKWHLTAVFFKRILLSTSIILLLRTLMSCWYVITVSRTRCSQPSVTTSTFLLFTQILSTWWTSNQLTWQIKFISISSRRCMINGAENVSSNFNGWWCCFLLPSNFQHEFCFFTFIIVLISVLQIPQNVLKSPPIVEFFRKITQ